MYRDKFIYGLMAASALFAACTDDFGVADGPKKPVATGDEILFGAENLVTFQEGFTDGKEGRTIYIDDEVEYVPGADGKPGTWIYPLRWVYGDSISIFSPQASYPNDGGKGYANYKIAWEGGKPNETAPDDKEHPAFLVKMGENRLHWGDLDEPHTFYAFYPKSFIDKDESFGTDIEHPSIVKGEIPKYQPMVKWEKITEGGVTHWVGRPNMELCLMHATTTVIPSQIGADSPVKLDFKPLTTAVEVTLEADKLETSGADQLQTLHVRGMSKDGTQKQSISGKFSFDLNTGKAVSLDQDITNDYEITVPLWVEGTDGPEPLKLEDGDKVTLTVFLLPQEQGSTGLSENPDPANRTLTNLQLEVINFNGVPRLKSYDGVNIPHGTKSQIILPKYSPGTGSLNNWMSRIPEETYISQLTIPGAAEAFSAEIISNRTYSDENQEYKFSQDLYVSDMFDKGVRAFDIGTRVDGWPVTGWTGKFKDAKLSCGGTDGSNVQTALSTIANKVKGTSEFAVVTIYFVKDDRGWDVWVNQLNEFLTDAKKEELCIEPYNSKMTVHDARGKVLLMARANNEEADGHALATKIPVIRKWNSMKDKWNMRGYNIRNDGYFLDADKVDAWTGQVNQWNGSGNPEDAGYTLPLSTDADAWKYTVISPEYQNVNNPGSAYIQEWRRVCKAEGDYSYRGGTQKWYESISEKKQNVINFFGQTKRALKDTPNVTALYINSLDGYYIINNSGSYSAAPNSSKASEYGIAGNIVDYAADMNDYVYKHMLSVPYDSRGPVGIVYFDFAGVEKFGTKTMHGDYLLKTLIGNNFSFPLMGKTGE